MTVSPIVRLIGPQKRRITTVTLGTPKASQLARLGWQLYNGPGNVHNSYSGSSDPFTKMRPEMDPRNGYIIPGSDPNLEPSTRPAGSIDFNPHVGETI